MITADELRKTEPKTQGFINVETQSLEKKLEEAHAIGLTSFIIMGRIGNLQTGRLKEIGYDIKEAGIYSCSELRIYTILSWS